MNNINNVDNIEIIMKKIDKIIIKCNKFNDKIKNKMKSNNLIHLEPPYNNICQFNCTKKAGYMKNNYYCCWYHVNN